MVLAVEADAALERIGRRLQERQELPVKIAQRRVVRQQRLVDLGEALEDRGIGGHLLAQADERAHDEDAHLQQVPPATA